MSASVLVERTVPDDIAEPSPSPPSASAPKPPRAGRGGFLVAAVAAIPLVFLPSGSLGGETVFLVPKLCWLAFVVVPGALWLARRSIVSLRPLAIPAALVAWMFAASAFHPHRAISVFGRAERLDGALPHLGLLIAALGGAALLASGQRVSLGRALAATGTALAAIVILQRFGVIGNLTDPGASITLADMPGATIGNRGYAACLVAGLLPFALEQAMTTVRTRSRSWAASGFSMAVAVGLAWTRGASVAAVAGLAVFAISQRNRRGRAVLASTLALAGLLLGSLTSASALGHNAETADRAHAFSAADSGRKPLYAASVWGIRHQPMIGYGGGGVLRAMQALPPATVLTWAGLPTRDAQRSVESNDQRLVLLSTNPNGTPSRYENITTKAHNELLDYAVSYGLPAAVLAALTMAMALWRSRRDAALCGAITAFAVGLLTWPQVMRTAPVLWCLLGLALAMGRQPVGDRLRPSGQRRSRES